MKRRRKTSPVEAVGLAGCGGSSSGSGAGDLGSGDSVSIKFDNTDTGGSWVGTGTTGPDGMVTFTLKNAPSGCYVTDVTDVTADGLTWDGLTPANEYCK